MSRPIDDNPLEEEIFFIMSELGPDEMEILLEIAVALRDGQSVYGEFDLDADPRDFAREALEEDRDWLIYRAADVVRQRRKLEKGDKK